MLCQERCKLEGREETATLEGSINVIVGPQLQHVCAS